MSATKPRRILQWIFGGLIAFAGFSSEIYEATGSAPDGAWSNIHFLFGLMLCLAVLCAFRYELRTHRGLDAAEMTAFARQLTRRVYVLLYLMLAVNLALPFVGGVDLSPESFQPYLAAGVAAILLTRGLAVVPIDGAALQRPRVMSSRAARPAFRKRLRSIEVK